MPINRPDNRLRRLRSRAALLLAALWILTAGAARAQLASSFCNVTGITTRTLPNAVQVTIQTDGAVRYGFEAADFATNGNAARPHPTSSFRIRIMGARISMPSFVDIGAYPVDSAAVSVGQDPLVQPYGLWGYSPTDPMVDVTLRFYVPVKLRRYDVGEADNQNPIVLGPREVQVKRGADRSSIVILVVTDHSDGDGKAHIQRSPAGAQHHRLSITPVANCPAGDEKIRVDALHAPLTDVLDTLSQQTGRSYTAESDAADVSVTALLPSTTPDDVVQLLENAYGLTAVPDSQRDHGIIVGRTAGSVTESIPMRYLKPENARLLLPDFLLPSIRVDDAANALVVSGPPVIVARIGRDLARLDLPTPQVRVDAEVWQFSSSEALDTALAASRVAGFSGVTVNAQTGETSLVLAKDQIQAFSASVSALETRGGVRLVSHPSVQVASGNAGMLFFGQDRYVVLLQKTSYGQTAEAVKLSIGTKIAVTPTVGADDSVTLAVSPTVSTVDDIQEGTGLPTLGIRQFSSVMRLRQGDAVMVAGLASDQRDDTRGRTSPWSRIPLLRGLFRTRNRSRQNQNLLLLIRATPA